MSHEIGILHPFREVIKSLEAWEADDRNRRGNGDEIVGVLAKVRAQLEQALKDAEDETHTLTPREYAAQRGISVWTVYKRWEEIPGARKDPVSKQIIIPASAAA